MATVDGVPVSLVGAAAGGGAAGLDAMQLGLEGVSRALDGMLARMEGGGGVDDADGAALAPADVDSIVDMLAAQAGADDDEELSGDEEGDESDGGGDVGGGDGSDEEIPEDAA